MMTTEEVAARFDELAAEEKWFEIQEELFGEDVRSVEPKDSSYFSYAEGKAPVRKKGEEFLRRIKEVHKLHTTRSQVAGKFFTVARNKDLTVEGLGRIKIDEIMLYEVRDGQIVLEQFFY